MWYKKEKNYHCVTHLIDIQIIKEEKWNVGRILFKYTEGTVNQISNQTVLKMEIHT